MSDEERANPILSSKDPNETKLYGVNAANMLPINPTPATLSGCSVVEVVPSDLTAGATAAIGTYGVVSTTGGTHGVDYALTMRLTFSDGQTRDRTITIPCRNR